mgnify:FL=1
MKLNEYELCKAFIMPCYWYIEGEEHEKFYVDEQTCDWYNFIENDEFNNNEKEIRKWWKIMLYKPSNIETKDLTEEQCKWLVNGCYHDMINIYDDKEDDTDYEKYEWDFKKHCIKKD